MAKGTTGACYICGAELGKTAMRTHLLKEHHHEGAGQKCCLLRIEGKDRKEYWLYVAVPLDKTLNSVDSFLRKIWLECCGHMSAFYAAGYQEIGKTRKWQRFVVGDKITHEYDFGSSTETVISVTGYIERVPQRDNVLLLARNLAPVFACEICGEPAEFICPECGWETPNPFYCEKCADEHEHEFLLPVTNSPRMGVCGYDGELDIYEYATVTKTGEKDGRKTVYGIVIMLTLQPLENEEQLMQIQELKRESTWWVNSPLYVVA